jgi:hypothetical protein
MPTTRLSALRCLFALFVMLIGLHAAPSFAQKPGELVQGMWVSTERSRGGLGMVYTVLADGTVVEDFGAVVDFAWSEQDSHWSIKTDGSEMQVNLAADGKTISLRQAQAPDQTAFRAGPVSTDRSLIGLWRFQHQSGAPATMVFAQRGQGVLLVQMKQRRGTLQRTDDGALTITMESGQDRTLTGRVQDDILTLSWGAKTMRFKRIVMR